jgi:ribonuclease T
VGHNAAFDLGFINAAVARADVKRNPFHPFSCFDTATLAGAALGQTVLAKAVRVAGLEWDPGSAHSARYDAERSAEIFCLVCNRLKDSHQAAEERARALGWVAGAAASDEPEPQAPV